MWQRHERCLDPEDIDVADVGPDGFDRTTYVPAELRPLLYAPRQPSLPLAPVQPPNAVVQPPNAVTPSVLCHPVGPVLFPPAQPQFIRNPYDDYGQQPPMALPPVNPDATHHQLRQPTYFLHQGNVIQPPRLPTPGINTLPGLTFNQHMFLAPAHQTHHYAVWG